MDQLIANLESALAELKAALSDKTTTEAPAEDAPASETPAEAPVEGEVTPAVETPEAEAVA